MNTLILGMAISFSAMRVWAYTSPAPSRSATFRPTSRWSKRVLLFSMCSPTSKRPIASCSSTPWKEAEPRQRVSGALRPMPASGDAGFAARLRSLPRSFYGRQRSRARGHGLRRRTGSDRMGNRTLPCDPTGSPRGRESHPERTIAVNGERALPKRRRSAQGPLAMDSRFLSAVNRAQTA